MRTTARDGRSSAPAIPIGEVDARRAAARPTGVAEFDRVLGGGLVPGAVVLRRRRARHRQVHPAARRRGPRRAGERGDAVLYVSGEESAAQVRLRAERIEAMARTLYLAAETDLATVLGQIDAVEPELVVVDSVQTIAQRRGRGRGRQRHPGPRGRRRRSSRWPRRAASPSLLVGHVTKDGSIAGPRVLEHLVDVVLQFEGDRHSRLRLVRAVKNRYGPTDEVGCFDLSDVGIVGLADPSGLFLSSRDHRGRRHLRHRHPGGPPPAGRRGAGAGRPVALPTPRRATSGLDAARVAMILAVLDKRADAADRRQRRLRRPRSAGCGSPSRPPTSRSASRVAGAVDRPAAAAGTDRVRRGRAWPARSARSPASTAGSPRPPGSASPGRVVPAGSLGGGPHRPTACGSSRSPTCADAVAAG